MDQLGVGSQIVGFLIVLVVVITGATGWWLRELVAGQMAAEYEAEIRRLRLLIAEHQLWERGLEEKERDSILHVDDDEDENWIDRVLPVREQDPPDQPT